MTQKNKPLNSPECPQKNSEKFDQYLSGKLSPEEMDTFEQHYFQCDTCFKELQFRREVSSFVKETAEELREDAKKANKRVQKEGASTQPITAQQDAFIKQKTRSTGNWIYAAAAIIALLLLVYFTLPLVNQNDPGAGDELAETALPARSAFTPSPYLETRINESYRNSDRISILTPPNDVQYMDSLQFRWELNANAPEGQDSLAFFILNNMEEKIFFQQVNGQQFTLMEQLSPGLYYWLLETEVETIHMGKFHVGEP